MSCKRTILFIISDLHAGGMQMSLLYLLGSFDNSRFRCHVWCLEGYNDALAEKYQEKGIKLHIWGLKALTSFQCIRILPRMWRRKSALRPDIICCYSFDAELVGFFFKLVGGREKLITTRRDLGDWGRTAQHDGYRRMMKPFVAGVIANCRKAGKLYIRRERLPEDKVTVIANGISDTKEENNRDDARNEFGADATCLILLMVANLNHRIKGHEELVDAAIRFIPEFPECRMVLVGNITRNPGYLRELKDTVKAAGISGNVYFTGSRNDVKRLIAAADICLNTSRSEGMSNAVLEYMASEKPVIVTDAGGNADMVEHGKTGIVVPVGQADAIYRGVVRLIRNAGERSAMGKAGRQRFKRLFTAEIMADNYMRYFDGLYQNER